MSKSTPSRSTLDRTTDAVVEYALLSLEPEFLRWEREVNMQIAEFVWNAGGLNLDPSAFHAPGGDLSPLVAALCAARQTRWPDEDVLLLGLDARYENGELLFTFDLSWDEGESFQACRIAVEHHLPSPSQQN